MMAPTLFTTCNALPPEGEHACSGRPSAARPHAYLTLITMADGSQDQHHGLYADGFAAVITAMETFPSAQRISARRLP